MKTSELFHLSRCSEESILERAMLILEDRVVKDKFMIQSPDILRQYLKVKIGSLQHEEFHAVYLDTQNQVIDCVAVFRGTISQTSVYPREIVKQALSYNASAVIFAHNHPSGLVTPSEADRNITQELQKALKLVDVRVLDHMVIAGVTAYSFAEHGLI